MFSQTPRPPNQRVGQTPIRTHTTGLAINASASNSRKNAPVSTPKHHPSSALLVRHALTEPRQSRLASSASISHSPLLSRPVNPFDAANISMDKHSQDSFAFQPANPSRHLPDIVLLQSATHKATVIGESHPDALQFIQETNLGVSAIHAVVDQTVGYAIIAVPDRCFVWQYTKKNATYIPPCMQFPMGDSAYKDQHALVSFVTPFSSGARQTGLLACTADGRVRFWENITFNPESFREIKIPIAPSDCVSFLINCDPVGFVIGTQNSVVFQVSLFDLNGLGRLTCTPIQRSSGMFNRVTSLFGYGSQEIEVGPVANGNLVCLIPGKVIDGRTGCELYVLTQDILQKWILSKTQADKLVMEVEIHSAIRNHLANTVSIGSHYPRICIEDADFTRNDQLAILVGYSISEPQCHYSVLVCQERSGILNWDHSFYCNLKFSQDDKDAPPLSLALSNGGPFFFANTTDHVIISTLEPDVDFEELLPFTQTHTHILGLGVDKPRIFQQDANAPVSAIAVFHGSSPNLVQITVSATAVRADDTIEMNEDIPNQVKERSTQILCAKLEQAVFFGSNSTDRSNPIAFDLVQPGGDIDAASLHVSRSILNSTSQHIHSIIDMRAQLSGRFHRIDHIISIISSHGLLHKISLATRFKLAFNVEKIAVAEQLWRLINQVRGDAEAVKRNKSLLILEESIDKFMTSQLSQEDPIKDFFEHKIEHMDEFLVLTIQRVRDMHIGSGGKEAQLEVFELNRIMMIAFSAALEYRQQNMTLYELSSECVVESWTATDNVLTCLIYLYEATLQLLKRSIESLYSIVEDPLDELDLFDLECSSVADLKFKMGFQFCKLADLVLGAFHERLGYLTTCGPQEEHRLIALKEKYSANLSKIIQPLVHLGHADHAFELAEKYRELDYLVNLCLNVENQSHRIKTYLDLFGFEFSDVLFETYLKKCMYHELLVQPIQYHEHLDRFFSFSNTPSLSWIHDIVVGRYPDASKALWDVAGSVKSREKQMLALSLSKLAAVEAAESLESFQESKFCTQFERARDLVILQDIVTSEFMEMIPINLRTGTMNVDKQTDLILSKCFSQLTRSRPVLLKIVQRALQVLLCGFKLELHDTLELFTIRDSVLNEDNSRDRFLSAMEQIGLYLNTESNGNVSMETDSKETEQFYVQLVWRRAWLSGGWVEILGKFRHSSIEQTHALLRKTSVFAIIHEAYAESIEKPYLLKYLIPPQNIVSVPTPTLLRTLHPDLDDAHARNLYSEYVQEQDAFFKFVQDCNLEQMFNECVRLCLIEMSLMIE
ncbi:hypothetical protein O5D80_000220 [Batrachochytrium dendrobatidis]|nr:hypothetical protein O5D80_000220 [Batrachochytrium dendrobatidis]